MYFKIKDGANDLLSNCCNVSMTHYIFTLGVVVAVTVIDLWDYSCDIELLD